MNGPPAAPINSVQVPRGPWLSVACFASARRSIWHALILSAVSQRGRPHATVAKFLRCAGELCPLHSPSTVIFVATDFRYIHKVPSTVPLAAVAADSAVRLRPGPGGDGGEARSCER